MRGGINLCAVSLGCSSILVTCIGRQQLAKQAMIVHRLDHLVAFAAGHSRGAEADRGPEPRHLDAASLHSRHGGQHWRQLL